MDDIDPEYDIKENVTAILQMKLFLQRFKLKELLKLLIDEKS